MNFLISGIPIGFPFYTKDFLCYKYNAKRFFDYSFGLKFAGGGFFVSLHCRAEAG
jgi:hypothetical protein